MIVTKKIEDFVATVVEPNNSVKDKKFSKMMGPKGAVLFFYPKDFTFVCPTEIVAFDNKVDEFKKRGYNVIGCSVDNEYAHIAWKNTPVNQGGIGQVKYDLISDLDKKVAKMFDVLIEEKVALRGSFLIDNEMVCRHAVINDLPLGRSIDEMIRMVDALEFYKENGEVCPANWHKGKAAIKADPKGIASYLSKNSSDLK